MILKWINYEKIEQQNIPECPFNEKHYRDLINELAEKEYIICGDTHQALCIPVFEDGYLMLSMRRWAEIMEEVFKNEHPFSPQTPNFYMASTCSIKENLPK